MTILPIIPRYLTEGVESYLTASADALTTSMARIAKSDAVMDECEKVARQNKAVLVKARQLLTPQR